jgi:uncharacterized protein YjbI with pentapeptide repeats
MNRKKRRQKTEPRPKKQIGWWVLWAFGMVVALVTMGLLLARLYPGIWATLSKERVAMLIGMGVALVAVIVLLAIGGASLGWTGFGDKTLWEWVQLLSSLAMPIVLAIAGFWFTTQQEKSGRKIEEQRAYDVALQAYVDQMSTLLIAKDLRSATEDNATEDTKEAQTVARARTVAVLGSLGPDLGQGPNRKRTIIKFLHEASLIDKDNPVIRLEEANLGGADLNYAILPDARLPFVFLNGANLERANLQDADLGGATLTDANLSNTNLNNANLTFANLSSANLDRVDRIGARFFEPPGAPISAKALRERILSGDCS